MTRYVRSIEGPSVQEGFIVLEGVAVIIGARETFTICAGACWPGVANLPEELFNWCEPADVQLTPGARISHARQSPREQEFAVASLRAQALRSGRTSERLALLVDAVGTPDINRSTMAAAIASTRENVSKIVAHYHSEEGHHAPS